MRNISFKQNLIFGIIIFLCLNIFFGSQLYAELVTKEEATEAGERWISYILKVEGKWGESVSADIADCRLVEQNKIPLGYHISVRPQGHIFISILKVLPPVKSFSTSCDLLPYDKGYGAMLFTAVETLLVNLERRYGNLASIDKKELAKAFSSRNRKNWGLFLGDKKKFKEFLASQKPTEKTSTKKVSSASAVQKGPLLKTKWGQDSPFNDLAPTACGSKTLAGCVAIATAQIMKYWNHPPYGYGSHSYTWDGDGCGAKTLTAVFSDGYDWVNMQNSYSGGETAVQKAAVAELCYEVGVAYDMDFGRTQSGAWPSYSTIFQKYFYYKSIIDDEYRTDYPSDDAWFVPFKEEIDFSRPVQFTIWGSLGGHSVVVDGYRIDIGHNEVHINMGWSGSSDNYYTFDGIIGFGFEDVNSQHMVRRIEPGQTDICGCPCKPALY